MLSIAVVDQVRIETGSGSLRVDDSGRGSCKDLDWITIIMCCRWRSWIECGSRDRLTVTVFTQLYSF